MMNKKGFTLVELMVVIVIIGVLAAVALPKFADSINKSRASEVPKKLQEIAAQNSVREGETGYYTTDLGTAGLNITGLTSGGTKFFDYSVTTVASPAAFTATATSKSPFVVTGATATLTDAGVKGADANMLKYVSAFINN